MAAEALEGLADALAGIAVQLDGVEPQLRNARMTDALQLGSTDLHEQYPEAVTEEGYLTADTYEEQDTPPSADPYGFWSRTDDAGLFRAVRSAVSTADRYSRILLERQPKTK